MKIEKITNLGCFCDFSHGAVIKTESGRSLGATCDPREAENIIRNYFMTEFSPEPVHVYFSGEIGQSGTWGYTFRARTTKRCNECLECHHFSNGCDGNSEPCEAFEYRY
jgi:hypothetical protein